MNRYLRSIRRRLNLPREMKDRILADLEAAVAARQEAGQTDAEIQAEMGSPKKVAAELNEQMAEYGYRKSPWRFLFLAGAVISGGWLVFYALVQLFFRYIAGVLMPSEHHSIGIIGGADGPTAIFVTGTTTGADWDLILMGGLCIIGILGYLVLKKCKPKKESQ